MAASELVTPETELARWLMTLQARERTEDRQGAAQALYVAMGLAARLGYPVEVQSLPSSEVDPQPGDIYSVVMVFIEFPGGGQCSWILGHPFTEFKGGSPSQQRKVVDRYIMQHG